MNHFPFKLQICYFIACQAKLIPLLFDFQQDEDDEEEESEEEQTPAKKPLTNGHAKKTPSKEKTPAKKEEKTPAKTPSKSAGAKKVRFESVY